MLRHHLQRHRLAATPPPQNPKTANKESSRMHSMNELDGLRRRSAVRHEKCTMRNTCAGSHQALRHMKHHVQVLQEQDYHARFQCRCWQLRNRRLSMARPCNVEFNGCSPSWHAGHGPHTLCRQMRQCAIYTSPVVVTSTHGRIVYDETLCYSATAWLPPVHCAACPLHKSLFTEGCAFSLIQALSLCALMWATVTWRLLCTWYSG